MRHTIEKAIEMLEKFAGIKRAGAHCGACSTETEIVEVKQIADEILQSKVDNPNCVWLAAYVRGDEFLSEGAYRIPSTCNGEPRDCAGLYQVEVWVERCGVLSSVASNVRTQHHVSCFETCVLNPVESYRPVSEFTEEDAIRDVVIPEGFGYDV